MVAEKRRPDNLELRKTAQEFICSMADNQGNGKIKRTSRAHRYEDPEHNQADGLVQNPRMHLAAPLEQN